MIFGILDFPHSICTDDFVYAIDRMLEQQVILVDWKADSIPDVDILILTDYVDDHTYPLLKAVKVYLSENKKLLAVGDGVKTMIEWGLLPGKLEVNISERIVSKEVEVRADNIQHFLTNTLNSDHLLNLSITGTHCRWLLGNSYETVIDNDQVLFRYHNSANEIVDMENETETIVGLANSDNTVFGVLFHPERAVDDEIGNTDGAGLFHSMISYLEKV